MHLSRYFQVINIITNIFIINKKTKEFDTGAMRAPNMSIAEIFNFKKKYKRQKLKVYNDV